MRRRSKGGSLTGSGAPLPRAAPKATARRQSGAAANAPAASSSNDRNQITWWLSRLRHRSLRNAAFGYRPCGAKAAIHRTIL